MLPECGHWAEAAETIRGPFVAGGDDAGFAPSFVEKPRIIPNDSGTLITMKCKCKAKPKPVVTWYRGTTVVVETSKIRIGTIEKDDDTYELTLEIKVCIHLLAIYNL